MQICFIKTFGFIWNEYVILSKELKMLKTIRTDTQKIKRKVVYVMLIMLQNTDDAGCLHLEQEIVKEIYTNRRMYLDMKNRNICMVYANKDNFMPDKKELLPKHCEDAVPIGTIDFVNAWMHLFHGHGMNPVEVPKCLRKEPFVCREYHITNADGIPRTGEWFIKDVTQLKAFSTGLVRNMEKIDFDLLMKDDYVPESGFDLGKIEKNHLFLASGFIDVKTEYRAYFIRGKLNSICCYSGDLLFYPDVQMILDANEVYMKEKDYPGSYTMDVMVTETHTEILEIHPFASVGLYTTIWPENLLYAYQDGIRYYIEHNTPVSV